MSGGPARGLQGGGAVIGSHIVQSLESLGVNNGPTQGGDITI